MSGHLPVMLKEVVAAIAPKDGGHYVDGTFGGGGYARAILEAADCRVWASTAIPTPSPAARLWSSISPAASLWSKANSPGWRNSPMPTDGVMLDLGVSSFQFDTPARGFSFREEGPLDMRMSLSGESAADLVNERRRARSVPASSPIMAKRRMRAASPAPSSPTAPSPPPPQLAEDRVRRPGPQGPGAFHPSRHPHLPGAAHPRE